MPTGYNIQEIKEVFDYIDQHSDIGVTPDDLFNAGLFGRKGDAASWLSRWKAKGFLTSKPSKDEDIGTNRGRKRTRYFTIRDSGIRDWVYAYNKSFRVTEQMRYDTEQLDSESGDS